LHAFLQLSLTSVMKKHDERNYLLRGNSKNCKFKIRKINMQKMHI